MPHRFPSTVTQRNQMGKKKGSNNNSKSNAASVESMPRASDDAAAQSQQAATAELSVDDMTPEQLRSELLAARAELARLKADPQVTAGKLRPTEDVQELTAKLQQLRKDQAEADAARDKAWTQLKVKHGGCVDLAPHRHSCSFVGWKPHTRCLIPFALAVPRAWLCSL